MSGTRLSSFTRTIAQVSLVECQPRFNPSFGKELLPRSQDSLSISPAGGKSLPLLAHPELPIVAASRVFARRCRLVPTEGSAVEREVKLSLLGFENAEGKRHADLTTGGDGLSYLGSGMEKGV